MHCYQNHPDLFIYVKKKKIFQSSMTFSFIFTIWLTTERQEEKGRDLIGWLLLIDRRFL